MPEQDLFDVIREAEDELGITPSNVRSAIADLRAGRPVTLAMKDEVTARAAVLLEDDLLPRVEGALHAPGSVHGLSVMRSGDEIRPMTRREMQAALAVTQTPAEVIAVIRNGIQTTINFETISWTVERLYLHGFSPHEAHAGRVVELLRTDAQWAAYVARDAHEQKPLALLSLYMNGGFNTALRYFLGPMAEAKRAFRAATGKDPSEDALKAMFRAVRPFGKKLASTHMLLHNERAAALSPDEGASFRPGMLAWDAEAGQWGFSPEAARAFRARLDANKARVKALLAQKGTTAEGIRSNCVGLYTSAFERMEQWLAPVVDEEIVPRLLEE